LFYIYKNALQIALNLECALIAFPFINTSATSILINKATKIALIIVYNFIKDFNAIKADKASNKEQLLAQITFVLLKREDDEITAYKD
jgi:hypothetical protein